MLELIFAVAVLVGFLVLLDRKDKRHLLIEADYLRVLNHQADAARVEAQTLLQRIQAPEAAVVQYQQTNADDENPWPLSDEESAEAQNERQRMIAELERIENAGLV